MRNSIWACDALVFPSLIRGFWADLDDGSPRVFTAEEQLAICMANEKGESLPRKSFPERAYWCRPKKSTPDLPPIMHSSFIFMRGDVVEIIEKFDLGGGALYSVELYENDKVTKIDVDYYCLNIGNKKDTLLVEKSAGLYSDEMNMPGIYSLPVGITAENNRQIVVDKSALKGPDIWADPKVWQSFFLSGRLAERLVDCGYEEAMQLRMLNTV